MTIDLKELERFTKHLAVKAGDLIAQKRNTGDLEKNYKGAQELVTSADVAADKLIIDAIQKQYPEHRILSEETYTDKSQLKDLDHPIWIIDPVDGTVNYALAK